VLGPGAVLIAIGAIVGLMCGNLLLGLLVPLIIVFLAELSNQ